uniref:Uncharacterized protein n=1 Tax=Candidatus Kentrum sp. FM TaxID=2126340 RepID=A0A450S6E1_9GAMM|nr:MAG: hypothetical protein BECKFM1743A_GA0114220_1004717 [Candidatus Kentron sp. FM]VFJ47829.1 MAG: hypothetical protein BECKFM1743C_GA0114222_100514 [Candidatus Kentron sp. FM]VFK07868.1 MAG: hypothetical protein BECKFM1743B_GA0114221_1005216 [Candidatus Kentron sp. FM]
MTTKNGLPVWTRQQEERFQEVIMELGRVAAFPPVVTADRFAEMTGIEAGVVTGWVYQRKVPVRKIGKRTVIDMIMFALTSPYFTEEKDE